MDVSRIRALRGPNLWSRHTAIQAIVRCDGAETAIADLLARGDGLSLHRFLRPLPDTDAAIEAMIVREPITRPTISPACE